MSPRTADEVAFATDAPTPTERPSGRKKKRGEAQPMPRAALASAFRISHTGTLCQASRGSVAKEAGMTPPLSS